MLQGFGGISGIEQRGTQPHAMRDGRRAIEFRARLAHRSVGIDKLREGPRCRPRTTRLPQSGQVNDKEVDQTAKAREKKHLARV
ncbi:hypothetical protein HDG32_004070 [Paraburkholderia sp. CI2]|nr:hypothetical protein [Paraburkholderia sp. CI2]